MTATSDPSAATLAKAAHENFPVAPRFLPRAWRDDLMAVYGFARLVDDIGDGDLPPGGADATLLGVDRERSDDRLALLDALAADLDRAFAPGGAPRHPLLLALVPTVRRAGLTPEPFRDLVEANRLDQRVRRYETQSQLLRYCELSANPVGRLVLAVTGTATPERVRRSDAICTALQLVEHLQDVSEDLARGRVYLPATAMLRFRVTERDLARPTANASVRTLVAYQTERARRLLDEGAPLVGSVHGRLRLLLAGFLGGGYAAAHAIAQAGYDVLAGPPRASRGRLVYAAATALRRRGT
ncbi:squalene synthase HpnC [Streptomyces sp. 3MP-14]|uniref:Squalene synthase HpnC n=1 Tax=Streptomyces mimosae TaxID=2586635 RepID=A0A5N6AEU6_9ACTN|nr:MULTISPECIES: squalene synthase HpnC [Streptomyces]KAB8166563.1 squalene synthase HpnC [Streptomyces mimosae]KAB8179255.1 squalene synthase HpnC [Streptomyces sp. 3MP-14]